MHDRRSMRGEAIRHHMHLQRGLDARLDLTQEREEVLRPMLRLATRQHLAPRDVQCREEVEWPLRT
jgi:hypothetical protein